MKACGSRPGVVFQELNALTTARYIGNKKTAEHTISATYSGTLPFCVSGFVFTS